MHLRLSHTTPFRRKYGVVECCIPALDLHGSMYHTVSTLFQPLDVSKKPPSEGENHSTGSELLRRAGYIRLSSSGVYHILPLGQRVLDKLTRAVHRQMVELDAQRITLPSLTPFSLWKTSGRAEMMGGELLTIVDRNQRKYALNPTHEEAVCQLLASTSPIPHRQLPLLLYQISSKFRDEMRPRMGLLRCKEFVMKDLYSFDATPGAADLTYQRVTAAYSQLFKRLGLNVVKVRGDSGVMGGAVSHEYHLLSDVGEDRILLCERCGLQSGCPSAVNAQVLQSVSGGSAIESGLRCETCRSRLSEHSAIEVGHTFQLGSRYTELFGAEVSSQASGRLPLSMCCFGLGLTRIMAAAVEASTSSSSTSTSSSSASTSSRQEQSSTVGIRWPIQLAPYRVCVILPRKGSPEESAGAVLAESLLRDLAALPELRDDVVVDDRTQLTIGQRVREARFRGYPCLLVLGKHAADGDQSRVEMIGAAGTALLTQGELMAQLGQMSADITAGTDVS